MATGELALLLPATAAVVPQGWCGRSGGLRLRGPGVADGFVDGGWWPRSLDLGAELAGVLVELFAAGYDVARVLYRLQAWDPAPRELTVLGRVITLEGWPTQEAASIGLVVVVPPDTDPVIAEAALCLAGLDGDLHPAAEILDHARHSKVAAGPPHRLRRPVPRRPVLRCAVTRRAAPSLAAPLRHRQRPDLPQPPSKEGPHGRTVVDRPDSAPDIPRSDRVGRAQRPPH